MPTMPQERSALHRATYAVAFDDLPSMLLVREQLPLVLRGFQELREEDLDNAKMAGHGFGRHTAGSLARLGRLGGRVREFVRPPADAPDPDADEVLAATVVHLFQNEQQVSAWIDDVFVKEFLERVGKDVGHGQVLTHAEQIDVEGFHDRAAGIFAIQRPGGPGFRPDGRASARRGGRASALASDGTLASTVIDFRVGRLLGVAYVVALGGAPKLDVAVGLARALEQQMVRVVLD